MPGGWRNPYSSIKLTVFISVSHTSETTRTLARSHQLGLEFFPNLLPGFQQWYNHLPVGSDSEPETIALPFWPSYSFFPPLHPTLAPKTLTITLHSTTKIRTPATPLDSPSRQRDFPILSPASVSSLSHYSLSDRLKHQCSQRWWHTPVMQALQRLKDCKLVSLRPGWPT